VGTRNFGFWAISTPWEATDACGRPHCPLGVGYLQPTMGKKNAAPDSKGDKKAKGNTNGGDEKQSKVWSLLRRYNSLIDNNGLLYYKGKGGLKAATAVNVRHILCEKHSKATEALQKLKVYPLPLIGTSYH
jgi:hypothetical protein